MRDSILIHRLRQTIRSIVPVRCRRSVRRQHAIGMDLQWQPAEVLEDRMLLASDFGDAPAPYPVTLAEDGARHEAVGVRFGPQRTAEADGQHSAQANADASDDGIYFGRVNLYQGVRRASVFASLQNLHLSSYLDGWIDFNADGDWTDPGEKILDSVRVSGGLREFHFDVPLDAEVGQTFARFRISHTEGLGVTGYADSGEVEDLAVDILFGAPTLDGTTPTSRTQHVFGTTRPTLTWAPIPDAVQYEVFLQKNQKGTFETGRPIERRTVSTNSFTPDFDLPLGFTQVWLRSIRGDGTTSVWSKRFVISIEGGVATSFLPMDRDQLTSTPTLTWEALSGGGEYDLWVSNLTTGIPQVIRTTVPHTTLAPVTFTVPTELDIGHYRAWVQVYSDTGRQYDWSQPVDFRVVPPPEVVAAAPSTFDRTPELAWQTVQGAASYEVHVTNINTGNVVLNPTGIAGTSWSPAADLPDGSYRWQVIAVGTNGFRSLWSEPTEIFIGGRNELTSPQNGDLVPRLTTFSWTPVEGAAYYELIGIKFLNTGRQYTLLDETNLTGTSATVIIGRNFIGGDNGLRVWVRAISSTGEVGPWSRTPLDIVVFQG